MKVYQAITKVQQELAKEGIAKDRKTNQYAFRGIDDIYNAIANLLSINGLCILPRMLSRSSTEYQTKTGGTMYSVVVEAEFDFVAVEDGSKHTVKTWGEAFDSGDKATNKAMTAAHKYALIQTFTIPTEGDNDADATVQGDSIIALIGTYAERMARSENIEDLGKEYARGVNDLRGNRQALVELAALKDRFKTKLTEGKEAKNDGASDVGLPSANVSDSVVRHLPNTKR